LTLGATGFHGAGGLPLGAGGLHKGGDFEANSGHALGHIHQHGHHGYGGYGYGGYGLYDGGYYDSNYCTPYWLKVDPALCTY